LAVQTGGAIDVSAKGLLGGNTYQSPCGGAGQTLDASGVFICGVGEVTTYWYVGGSHAGAGGHAGASATYGSQDNPQYLGAGGNGGGKVLINAGTFQLDGSIRADGAGPYWPCGRSSAGGAGGSVNITATTFSGAGNISAVGGPGYQNAGGGGGGRIKVAYG